MHPSLYDLTLFTLNGLAPKAAERTENHAAACECCSVRLGDIREETQSIKASLQAKGVWSDSETSIWLITGSGRQAAFYIAGEGKALTGTASDKGGAIRTALLKYAGHVRDRSRPRTGG